MTTLETVPDDIKYLFLASLEDVRSLKALCQVSALFAAVFSSRPSTIKAKVYFADALKYKNEALWVTSIKSLSAPVDKTIMVTAIDMYIRTSGTAQAPYTIDGNTYSHISKDLEETLYRNHEAVAELYEDFTKLVFETQLLPDGVVRTHVSPTESEERRIMKALYRTWMVLLICEKIQGPMIIAECTGKLFHTWGFWENVAVWGVLQGLYRGVFKTVVDKLGEMATAGVLSRFNSRSVPESDLTSLCLVYDFPEKTHRWIRKGEMEPGQAASRVLEIFPLVHDRDPGAWLRDSMSNEYQVVVKAQENLNANGSKQLGDDYARDRPRVFKRDRYMLGTYFRGVQVDLGAYVWDDWRLEQLLASQIEASMQKKVRGKGTKGG
ncbi:hypothetical protein TWF694_003123 [Orbilia ellipsospora]|uniref:F-box domain-containing protein n=1 Tax=Orbilia ellipsospora TaxID=2528407 RepID=A0AAV9X0K7_9PEZI